VDAAAGRVCRTARLGGRRLRDDPRLERPVPRLCGGERPGVDHRPRRLPELQGEHAARPLEFIWNAGPRGASGPTRSGRARRSAWPSRARRASGAAGRTGRDGPGRAARRTRRDGPGRATWTSGRNGPSGAIRSRRTARTARCNGPSGAGWSGRAAGAAWPDEHDSPHGFPQWRRIPSQLRRG
jgi:hypothetical protein